MVILSIIIILAVLIGWRIRYNNSQLGWCKFDIFETDPNISTVLLFLGTAYSFVAITYYTLKILNLI